MNGCNVHATINCSGYDCPMVLVQLKEALDRLEDGGIVEVITDHAPHFQLILKGWAEETKDRYVKSFTDQDKIHHLMQKASHGVRKEPVPFPDMVTNDDLKSLLAAQKTIHIIDVREEIEFMLGHIPSAVNVPLSNFSENVTALEKDCTYYVICRTGNRSDIACKYMRKMGFKKIYNVLPGMFLWDGPIVEEI